MLERAAIVGKEFQQDEVLELLPQEARPSAPRHAEVLMRKQFIRPARSTVRGGDAFHFRHVLIQDAAYRGVPKSSGPTCMNASRPGSSTSPVSGSPRSRRSSATTSSRRTATEQSSPSDRQAAALAQRAGERLAAAGARAVARGDVHAAANLLGRSAALLPRLDPRRVALLPDLGESLAEAGRLAGGRAVLQEAVEAGHEIGNRSVEWRALAADGWWRLRMDRAPHGEIEELARNAIGALDEIGDESGLAKAWRLLGDVHHSRGELVRTCEATERAFEHAPRRRSARAIHVARRFGCMHVLGRNAGGGRHPAPDRYQ